MAFRFAVTKDEDARKVGWEAFSGMERLYNLTGIKGLMARSFLPKGAPIPGGTWHNSTTDPN